MSADLTSRMLWSSAPPEPRTRLDNWPTLLYSWWATSFAAVVILTRLSGRKVRSNVLFREDWIMLFALIPLFIRMAFIHVVLVYGTNNVATEGVTYTVLELEHRRTGARLVLAARIWYAVFIWMSKWAVSEFLKRITIQIWRPSYERVLFGIRVFLGLTLVAVIIATLGECRPIDHYWQVVPDPGAQCRQGFAQLLTMGTADIITDILLVVFPIPIVLRSGQTWRRKLQLVLLFSTSVVLIVVTGMRMPEVIARHGRQQYRTVWASSEILASAFVSNFVIIGSFLRDKGTKKNKYRSTSVSDSIERGPSVRRVLTQERPGDEDELFFRDMGYRIPAHLRDEPESSVRMAPAALPAVVSSPFLGRDSENERPAPSSSSAVDEGISHPSHDDLPQPSPALSNGTTKKSVSFFDVGGLLESQPPSPTDTRSRATTFLSTGNGTAQFVAYDFAPATPSQSRRGSHAFMADIGGMPSPGFAGANGGPRRGSLPGGRSRNGAPIGVLGPMLERQETHMSLQDAGGLLGGASSAAPAQHAKASSSTTAVANERVRSSQPSTVATTVPVARRGGGYEEMEFGDAGGLLK
nr:hypothetical protein B0A51_09748 [Rachicladosporium sp. CCFEE 5018]